MILAANLICRLSEPMVFFNRLKDLVVPSGIVVIVSPYSWLEQYTAKVYSSNHEYSVNMMFFVCRTSGWVVILQLKGRK